MSDEDRLGPAEARVRDMLAELREDAPERGDALPEQVASTLRWQRPLRRALLSLGTFAGALAGGVRTLAGRRGS